MTESSTEQALLGCDATTSLQSTPPHAPTWSMKNMNLAVSTVKASMGLMNPILLV